MVYRKWVVMGNWVVVVWLVAWCGKKGVFAEWVFEWEDDTCEGVMKVR